MRTYASLIVALLGFFGIADLFSEEEMAAAINSGLEFAGIIAGFYFRYKANKEG